MVRRSPSPDCPPSGQAVGVRHPHAVGAGVWVWGPNTVPLACMPCGGCVPLGWWGAVPGGGAACHGCERRLVSGAVPPLAARPLGRAARVPRPMCPGCGCCGRWDPAPAPRRAPLPADGARRGGAVPRREGRLGSGAPPPPGCPPSGRAVGVRYPRAVGAGVRVWGPCTGPVARVPCGGLSATGVAGGVWVQAPPLPCCPPSGRAAGARWPRAVGAGVGVCGVCGACAVRAVVLGVAHRLSLWCPPLWCFVAVLCSPCACRAPLPARIPCSSADYLPFLLWLRGCLPFPLPSIGSPSSLACTFSLPPPWCVSRSFPLPASFAPVLGPSSFSLVGSCETEGRLGRLGLLGN